MSTGFELCRQPAARGAGVGQWGKVDFPERPLYPGDAGEDAALLLDLVSHRSGIFAFRGIFFIKPGAGQGGEPGRVEVAVELFEHLEVAGFLGEEDVRADFMDEIGDCCGLPFGFLGPALALPGRKPLDIPGADPDDLLPV